MTGSVPVGRRVRRRSLLQNAFGSQGGEEHALAPGLLHAQVKALLQRRRGRGHKDGHIGAVSASDGEKAAITGGGGGVGNIEFPVLCSSRLW